MSLFNFRKKKEEKDVSRCDCSYDRSTEESVKIVRNCCGDAVNGICCIKVLGAGCVSCHQLYENVKKAVKNIGLSVEVEYITNMEKVIEYGVMSMPALVVNESIVSMGKVLKTVDVEKLLREI